MIRYTSQKQFKIEGFESPFTKRMNPNNRWVRMAQVIPWDDLVSEYNKVMREDFGRPGINSRIVIGSLIIKHLCGFSDEETVEHIAENIYMQYFLGYEEFNDKIPFDPSLFVLFRKRLGLEVFEQMNQSILRVAGLIKEEGSQNQQGEDHNQDEGDGKVTHKGQVLFDASVCPQDIKYPNDLEIISDARQKTEQLIDLLYDMSKESTKPRTDRKKARREFLVVAKKRSKTKKMIRKAIRKQLGYLSRNLKGIDRLLDHFEQIPLKARDHKYLLVIREVYRQQRQMYDLKENRVDDRIVSIHQPHVRPMVRGKASAKVEFGPKISLSMVDGYSMLDRLGWDAYHEGHELPGLLEMYRQRFDFYPSEVVVDKLYTGRINRDLLKQLGIKLIGKQLGRPRLGENTEIDPAGIRNPIEGKFGQGKRAYRLDRVFAKLKDTSESWIATSIFVMNLIKLVSNTHFSWLYTIVSNKTGKLIRYLMGFRTMDLRTGDIFPNQAS